MAELSDIKNTTSSDESSSIPEDLLTEIFARMPAKALIKLRSVCKAWRSIIDSSHFISLHLQTYEKNLNDNNLLVWNCTKQSKYSTRYSSCSKTFKETELLFEIPENCNLLGSFCGLILIKDYSRGEIELYNPFIKKSVLIPSCPFESAHVRYLAGFVPSSNDCKVTAFLETNTLTKPEVLIAVYSLKDNLWRIKDKLDIHVPGYFSWHLGTGHIFFKGAMYWIGDFYFYQDQALTSNPCLVSWDFNGEEFKFVDLPDDAKLCPVVFNFLLCKSMAVFAMSSECAYYIWVLVTDGAENSWRFWNSGYSDMDVFGILRNITLTKIYDADNNIFVVQRNGELYSYDYVYNKIPQLKDYTDGPALFYLFEPYVESLMLHKGKQEHTSTFN
ncbi:putative F-box protein At3g17480 [Spinacia oleracea]|uniref:F-box protein At3g17480 n=1 Tax=Spinacia oleracea TaxID=3562 RepID=A0A9R0IHY0_SPIOL|nr:putative F-box protein At3g17480 [Spinacia oleracea]XP_056684593.1 putative F-box protein At3g17480 [Spinacia oleracea]XP_056684594.1 putative F-box protein At3g17480 [Spinacia oleracea]